MKMHSRCAAQNSSSAGLKPFPRHPVRIGQLFDLVRRTLDVVPAYFSEENLPLAEERASFWVFRLANSLIESVDAVLSEFGLRAEVAR